MQRLPIFIVSHQGRQQTLKSYSFLCSFFVKKEKEKKKRYLVPYYTVLSAKEEIYKSTAPESASKHFLGPISSKQCHLCCGLVIKVFLGYIVGIE